MPWTQPDNAFSWLEITRRCDLRCDYCYQTNNPHSDKDMTTIETELLTLQRVRRCDTMFTSGGEPLLHPHLESIVRLVKSHGPKPVLVTNGHRLAPATVRQLKHAGLFGFILHVDRGQSRPGWTGQSERTLNRLRQKYADMINAEKGLICGFNTTILPETLHEVPDIVRYTVRNIHKVCTNCLIPVRVPRKDDPWDYYVQGKPITFEDTAFANRPYTNPSNTLLRAQDIYNQVRVKYKKPTHYYFRWQTGARKGREVIFVAGKRNNKIVAHPGGLFRFMTFHLNPEGRLAMKENRHSLKNSGLEKIMQVMKTDFQRAQQNNMDAIRYTGKERFDGRKVWVLEGRFPENQGYYAKAVVLYLYQILGVPIKVSIYDESDALAEDYVFHQLAINVDLTDQDFDPDNPDYDFF
jgi:hypothetical protein